MYLSLSSIHTVSLSLSKVKKAEFFAIVEITPLANAGKSSTVTAPQKNRRVRES
jgi:hypothetical protein